MADVVSGSSDKTKPNQDAPLEGTGKDEQHTGLTMEEFEQIVPDKSLRESITDLLSRLETDDAATMVLKGQLVLEEKINAIIDQFVFHPDLLDNARLTFAQKLSIVRSLSLDEHENSMWDLIERINKLRNVLAHSLKDSSRVDAMNALRSTYSKECVLADWEKKNEALLILSAVAHCLGFLNAFEQEGKRFKRCVKLMDVVFNPHRYFSRQKPDANAAKGSDVQPDAAEPAQSDPTQNDE